jgi:hypothetical protein
VRHLSTFKGFACIIPTPSRSDRCPIEGAEGADAAGLGEKRVPGGAVLRAIAEVWIPDPADWIPFYHGYILPFLRTYAEMATADHLDRIGNCLIAVARHGEGPDVNRHCGRSRIDINHDRELMRRAAQAAPGALCQPRSSNGPRA